MFTVDRPCCCLFIFICELKIPDNNNQPVSFSFFFSLNSMEQIMGITMATQLATMAVITMHSQPVHHRMEYY